MTRLYSFVVAELNMPVDNPLKENLSPVLNSEDIPPSRLSSDT